MYTTSLASLLAGALLLRGSIAGYVLTDNYQRDTFFGNFSAFTEKDPTDGFVKFHDYDSARDAQLIGAVTNYGDASYIGVDYKSKSTTGRGSVRISSHKAFNKGLFLADIAHMPSGCGTWPAFWLLGQATWPTGGEIDIIEGVNSAGANQMTLHTDAGCSVWNKGSLARVNTTNCDTNAPGQKTNAGCAYMSSDTSSYGAGFNAVGGGVYATEWTSQAISIWYFPRSKIPSDVASGNNPNPSKWGTPMAHFGAGNGHCDVDKHFQNMQIIFDTTFCGQWAGDKDVWSADQTCGKKAATCEAYVQNNPEVFKEAYWLVNSVKVFQSKGPGARKRGVSLEVGE